MKKRYVQHSTLYAKASHTRITVGDDHFITRDGATGNYLAKRVSDDRVIAIKYTTDECRTAISRDQSHS